LAKKSRTTTIRIIAVFLILTITVFVGVWLYEWWLARRAGFIRYAEFGIEIPATYSIHGIDVSKYQHIINWESVRNMHVEGVSIGFAFIKATEGNLNQDRFFKRNWKRAKEAGVVRGAYHFFLATKSGRKQAENFIRAVDIEEGDLPPVLDVEQTYGVPPVLLRQRVKEWLDIVEMHYGVKPILYTNVDFYIQILKDEFDEYPLWVAHYLQKNKPRIHRDWIFWQHSETGRVNGIGSKVDFNVFNGDSAAFRQLLVH
jgi:lysozyme